MINYLLQTTLKTCYAQASSLDAKTPFFASTSLFPGLVESQCAAIV